MNPKQVSPGEVFGHYQVEEFLVEGGWSAVYRARDLRLERTVALKVLLEGLQGDDATWARTLREARLASSLSHPNICTVYDVGEDEGRAYVAMEYIDGLRLSDHIQEGGLPLHRVITYGAEIAGALAHAHEHGIIHGDIKSSNVMITEEGIAKLVDFGLAKRFGVEDLKIATASRSSLAQIGPIAGTLSYLAPEVLRGKPTSIQSDIWALGILLHEMAYGRLPFKGDTPFDLSTQIMTAQRESLLPEIPRGLNAIIERCTEKAPARRYQSARDVLEELDTASDASPPEAPKHPSTWDRRALIPGALAAAVLLGLIFTIPSARNLILRRNAVIAPAAVPVQPQTALPKPPAVATPTKSARKPEVTAWEHTKAEALSPAVAAKHEQVQKHLARGAELSQKKLYAEAEQEYRAALELEPGNPDLHFLLGYVVDEQKKLNLAAADGRTALHPQPDNADAHVNLGNALKDKGDLDGGIAEFRTALRLQPDNAEAHFNLATALYKKGDLDGGIAEFRTALRLQPDNAETHFNLATALYKKGDPEGAIAEYRTAIRLQPDNAATHYNLGTALYNKGDPEGAVAEWRTTIRLQPDLAAAHENLGTALYNKGDPEGAITEYRASIQLQPGDAVSHYDLGLALDGKGDLNGAIAEYRTAIGLQPDLAAAHAFLGRALERKGDRRAALEELRRAYILEPKNSAIAQQYERLLRKAR